MDTKLKKSTDFHPQLDGQTEVVNMIVIQLLRGHYSKHPKFGMNTSVMCSMLTTEPNTLLHRDLLLRPTLISHQGLLWILSLLKIPWLMGTVMWIRQPSSLNKSRRSIR